MKANEFGIDTDQPTSLVPNVATRGLGNRLWSGVSERACPVRVGVQSMGKEGCFGTHRRPCGAAAGGGELKVGPRTARRHGAGQDQLGISDFDDPSVQREVRTGQFLGVEDNLRQQSGKQVPHGLQLSQQTVNLAPVKPGPYSTCPDTDQVSWCHHLPCRAEAVDPAAGQGGKQFGVTLLICGMASSSEQSRDRDSGQVGHDPVQLADTAALGLARVAELEVTDLVEHDVALVQRTGVMGVADVVGMVGTDQEAARGTAGQQHGLQANRPAAYFAEFVGEAIQAEWFWQGQGFDPRDNGVRRGVHVFPPSSVMTLATPAWN